MLHCHRALRNQAASETPPDISRFPSDRPFQDDLLPMEVPKSPVFSTEPLENVTLVPFGTRTLRITAFPILCGPAFDPSPTRSQRTEYVDDE